MKRFEVKQDDSAAKDGWAPGNCMHICIKCKDRFLGDKRAVQCATCAYKAPPKRRRINIVVERCDNCPFYHYEEDNGPSNNDGSALCLKDGNQLLKRARGRWIKTPLVYGIPNWCTLPSVEEEESQLWPWTS